MNAVCKGSPPSIGQLDNRDLALIEAVQDGLPIVPRPFAAIAARTRMDETEVIARLQDLQNRGLIARLGVVVRHHELGYRANAMVVWDVPDESVDVLGERFKEFDFVTLCYQRPRRPPDWPYNLFCMIHGRSREEVQQQVEHLRQRLRLETVPYEMLFSRRRFKQRGARFAGLTPRTE